MVSNCIIVCMDFIEMLCSSLLASFADAKLPKQDFMYMYKWNATYAYNYMVLPSVHVRGFYMIVLHTQRQDNMQLHSHG